MRSLDDLVCQFCPIFDDPRLLTKQCLSCILPGSNVRGAKPVTVYFGKYEDKEEVLRQVNRSAKPNMELVFF